MTTKTMTDQARRGAVRDRYARAATEGDGCCHPSSSDGCGAPAAGGDSMSCAVGYAESELERVPDGADLGLGCGNPVALASLAPGDVVLDLGSGAGLDCFLAAERVGREGRVVGVDMTPEMVERARANRDKGDYPNVEFRLGEIEALPVGDARIDVAISNCVLNLSGDRPRVLAEAMRVLKPGGRLMISDLVCDEAVPDFVASSERSLVGCLPVQASEYEADLAAAGFVEIDVALGRPYPGEHILADPEVQAVVRDDPARAEAVRAFAASIHGGAIRATKPR